MSSMQYFKEWNVYLKFQRRNADSCCCFSSSSHHGIFKPCLFRLHMRATSILSENFQHLFSLAGCNFVFAFVACSPSFCHYVLATVFCILVCIPEDCIYLILTLCFYSVSFQTWNIFLRFFRISFQPIESYSHLCAWEHRFHIYTLKLELPLL